MSYRSWLMGGTAAALLSATPVIAQQITSDVRGRVFGPDGEPIANASVEITDSRTGRTVTAQTGQRGRFSAENLPTGGPYIVTASAPDFQSKRIEDLRLSVSDRAILNFTLESAGLEVEELVVVGARVVATKLAIGPSSAFGLEDLQGLPTIDRDIRDIIRVDPRVRIDPSNDDSISCTGVNNRFNSFTVDGVAQNDSFGLNASGFPNRNNFVFPFDAVQEVAVEFAPFDVEYGNATGCAINVVTKSGSNEVFGSAFARYSNDELQGSSLDGEDLDIASFNDFNWGAEIGLPIIKDKLFFYVAYEETRENDVQEEGPFDGGFADPQAFVSVALANQVADILEDQYGIETGGITSVLPEESRRIITRLDYNITDDHRLAFTYIRNRETNVEPDGLGSELFQFGNSFEVEGTELDTFSLRLFNDWTENFSTEFRISRSDIDDLQDPVGGGEAQGTNIPQIVVGVPDGTGVIQAGPAQFRSANQLNTQIDQIQFKATYALDTSFGTHNFKVGYELNQLDVFNLFIINATSRINFATVADLIAGTPSTGTETPFSPDDDPAGLLAGELAGVFGNGSFTGDPLDAAAAYTRSLHSIYGQDEIQFGNKLTVSLGLRYDFFTSNDLPTENPNYIDRYGFTNAVAFNELEAILPRFGITYDTQGDFLGQTVFRAGAGIFGGGDPTVFISNGFQNFGGAIGFGQTGVPGCDPVVFDDAGNFTGVPQCVTDQQIAEASAVLADTQATDPNYELPTVVRGNIGMTHFTDFNDFAGGFFDDWRVNMDVIVAAQRNANDFVDLSLTPNINVGLNGFTLDGRPVLEAIDPTLPGCTAVRQGVRGGFTGVNDACFGSRDDEILLTNVLDGENGTLINFAVSLQKDFNYEFLNSPGSLFFNVGYAFTSANDANAGVSSTATSNFNNTASFDFLNHPVSNSNFENQHVVTIAARLRQEWKPRWATSFGLFYSVEQGRPFSYTFDGGFFTGFESGSDNALLYVPTGPDDPFIVNDFDSPEEQAAFFEFLETTSGLSEFAGGTAPRNAFRNDFDHDLDIRIEQEFPGFRADDRIRFFVTIENFLNIIDDSFNVFNQFDTEVDIVDATVNDAGQYVLSGFAPDFNDDTETPASLWTLQIGFRYEF